MESFIFTTVLVYRAYRKQETVAETREVSLKVAICKAEVYSIKLDVMEIYYERLNWVEVAQDSFQCYSFVSLSLHRAFCRFI